MVVGPESGLGETKSPGLLKRDCSLSPNNWKTRRMVCEISGLLGRQTGATLTDQGSVKRQDEWLELPGMVRVLEMRGRMVASESAENPH